MSNKNYTEIAYEAQVNAGFFPRLFAYFIDWLIIAVFTSPIHLTTFFLGFFQNDVWWDAGVLFHFSFLDITLYVCGILYFIVFTYFGGATLGKKAMNLKVSNGQGQKLTLFQVIYRETVGRFLSSVVFSLGYLYILIDKQKRGLHDVLADTAVIYEKKIKVITPVAAGLIRREAEKMCEAQRAQEEALVRAFEYSGEDENAPAFEQDREDSKEDSDENIGF